VKWIAFASTVSALLACASGAPPSERVIDLTHPFDEETI